MRRVKDYFQETKALTDSHSIEKEYNYGMESLEMLKRQVRWQIIIYVWITFDEECLVSIAALSVAFIGFQ